MQQIRIDKMIIRIKNTLILASNLICFDIPFILLINISINKIIIKETRHLIMKPRSLFCTLESFKIISDKGINITDKHNARIFLR